ncbi:maleylacetoacetate isomerase [Ruixingdingia sedimenti]|uniref:Maleylacetoacetate isomerase n=1 Tax=Ruixingdingia sedimenti TaxID=3073604 RepID=A0ABU1F4A0_9RHOB|nr:maleylacetoacetate isomerase [Xinfangfangia sp. LG-4]MDR5651644.1 maleylacetoacetate isomerase [Xinfangfangia sp. LG-4]
MTARPFLYDYWRSSASYRVRIALNLKGIAHDSASVDLVRGDQRSPEHLDRNPQGFVPALRIDGLLLTQSLAIIDYLDETRPEPPLLPPDATGRARVRALAHAVAMDIHPICNLHVAAHVMARHPDAPEAARQDWMVHFITRGLDALERMVGAGAYCYGDTPTLADICLVPQIYNARRWGVDLTRHPRLVAIDAACADLPAFADAHPDRVKPA